MLQPTAGTVERAMSPGAGTTPGRALPQRSVLCAQQRADVRQFLRDALGEFHVVVVASAGEVMRRLNHESFDAYVLDYWLSDWSGVSLCREIRKTDPHVPVCFYAAAGAGVDRGRVLRAGASASIESPTEPALLSRRMRVLMEGADARSLHAGVEAVRVIREELKRQAAVAAARGPDAMERAAKAIERSARTKALAAFIEAGGARAHFERWWPQQFDTCWASESRIMRPVRGLQPLP